MFNLNLYELLVSIALGIVVITVFEFIKALAASILGDDTPKRNGRLTLNPLKQIEPIGLLLFVFIGYGWGNPVEIHSGNFKNRKTGAVLTYTMPIIVSVIFAVSLNIISKTVNSGSADSAVEIISYLSQMLALYFARMAVFNIIPVYPLCGSYILKSCINPNAAIKYAQNERIIQIALIFLVLCGIGSQFLDFVVNLLIGW